MMRTITMTFEADGDELARALAARFESTPFGRCRRVVPVFNPVLEPLEEPDESREFLQNRVAELERQNMALQERIEALRPDEGGLTNERGMNWRQFNKGKPRHDG